MVKAAAKKRPTGGRKRQPKTPPNEKTGECKKHKQMPEPMYVESNDMLEHDNMSRKSMTSKTKKSDMVQAFIENMHGTQFSNEEDTATASVNTEHHDTLVDKQPEENSTITDPPSMNKPSSIEFTCFQFSQTSTDSMVIKDYVTEHIFPKVKFIVNKADEMRFSEGPSLCNIIMKGLQLENIDKKVEWWMAAKNTVHKKLIQLKNDRNAALKGEFFGK